MRARKPDKRKSYSISPLGVTLAPPPTSTPHHRASKCMSALQHCYDWAFIEFGVRHVTAQFFRRFKQNLLHSRIVINDFMFEWRFVVEKDRKPRLKMVKIKCWSQETQAKFLRTLRTLCERYVLQFQFHFQFHSRNYFSLQIVNTNRTDTFIVRSSVLQ